MLWMKETALRSPSTTHRYTVPPSGTGDRASGGAAPLVEEAGVEQPADVGTVAHRLEGVGERELHRGDPAGSPGAIPAYRPRPSSAATPCVGGGSSTTSTSR